ncbi:MAG: chemotaxis protein CheC [Bacillota bacterium]
MTAPLGRMDRLRVSVAQALYHAGHGLSEMVGRPISIAAPVVELVPTEDVAVLAGGPEQVVVGIYLGVTGQVTGHVLLIFSSASARRLAGVLWDGPVTPEEHPLTSQDVSALAEAANITTSFFFNYLSDRSGLVIAPTTPTVVEDMLGAVLDGVLAELSLYGEQALLTQTVFSGPSGELTGQLIFLPHLSTLQTLMEALLEEA